MIETKRLFLRQWKEQDFPLFANINTNPQVQQFFHYKSTVDESIAMARRLQDRIERYGYGLWAVEIKETGEFIGFVGLALVKFESHFSPCTEIAWRISPNYWNMGYATEAARAALSYGFEKIGLGEIFSFTLPDNFASRRVMEKIGMTYNSADDFEHPDIPIEFPNRKMVLYRAKKLLKW